jgi:hypothetical protein
MKKVLSAMKKINIQNIQNIFCNISKNLFVPKISKNIFLPEEGEGQGQGQEELSLPVLLV